MSATKTQNTTATATANNNITVESLQQFKRADEIINEATLAYETEQSKRAMVLSQVRQDAAQKFAKDNTTIINQVSNSYKDYLSNRGVHPEQVGALGDTRLSIYRCAVVDSSCEYAPLASMFGYHDIYSVYSAESQKACANTGEMLRMLGYKVASANTDTYNNILFDGGRPTFQHKCKFTFAASEQAKK